MKNEYNKNTPDGDMDISEVMRLLESEDFPTGTIRYTMRNDYMFKAVLQRNKRALTGLLAALLSMPVENIIDIEIKNPIELGDTIDDKTCILDIKLLLNNNKMINIRVMQGAPEKRNGEDGLPIPPYAVYNIGGEQPENLLDYIETLQEELVRAGVLPDDYDFEGHRELVGMQAGDVPITYADSKGLEKDYGFTPKIGIQEGLRNFAKWYKEYYS